MKKVITVIFVVLILLAGCRQKTDDRITEADRKEVEETCRKMIAAWEEDAASYKENIDIDAGKAEEFRMSANATAADYNKYMQTHAVVFNGTLPEDIYAAIEPIE